MYYDSPSPLIITVLPLPRGNSEYLNYFTSYKHVVYLSTSLFNYFQLGHSIELLVCLYSKMT
jgi:hypothetical protein